MVSYNAGMLMIVVALIAIIIVVVVICHQSSNDIVYTTPAAIAWPILIAVAVAAWGCSAVRAEVMKYHTKGHVVAHSPVKHHMSSRASAPINSDSDSESDREGIVASHNKKRILQARRHPAHMN